MIIRKVQSEDINALQEFGKSNKSFSVSDNIPFYESEEISEFIYDPNWIIGIALDNEEIIGFISIHRMSCHWAMLDNFYIVPSKRGTGLAKNMYNWLLEQIQPWKINYMSCLVDLDDEITTKLLIKQSWKPRKRYRWLDRDI